MAKKEKRCKDVIDVLKLHKASWKKPLTAYEISCDLGLYEYNSCPQTRKLIKQATETYDVPIGSCRRGYFIINTAQEMQRYCNDLLERQVGLSDRIESTYECCKRAGIVK